MRGEVVVQEELAAHEEEGEVVRGPAEEEEACAVVEAGASACFLERGKRLVKGWLGRRKGAWIMLTFIETVDAAALGELVCANDAGEDREETASDPPTDRVAEEVDLLSGVVLGPEADSTEEEWPLDGLTGIGMAAGEGIVVEEDGALQLEVLDQEREGLDFPLFLEKARAILRD